MKNEIEQGLHEKLCAYVLGEASDEVRAEIEAALAASAELREERAQLEQTIGLVQQTLGTGDPGPAISAEEILADARAARRRPWYASSAFRAAAGICGATLLGVIGYRAMHSEGRSSGSIVAVKNAKEMDAGKLRLAEGSGSALPIETNQPPAVAKTEAPAAGAPAEEQKNLLAAQSASRPAPGQPMIDSTTLGRLDRASDGKERTSNEVIDRSHATEYTEDSTIVFDSDPAGMRGSSLGGQAYRRSSDALASEKKQEALVFAGRETGAAPAAPSSSGASARPSGPTTGSDDFFIGGARGGAKDSLRLSSTEMKSLRGLGYIGDADNARDEEISDKERILRLDPADRDRWIENECQQILRRCRRLPNEKPRDMFFRFYGDNPFEVTALDAQSTFSVDVDTASYALARRYLNEGHIPEKAQVRTEEFVNYFKADVPHPTQGTFSIHTDLTPSRFSADKARSMLRVVVSGKEVSKQDRKPLNLTFVIDVSGSMREQGRLEMVKHAIRLLVTELGGGDNLAIVAFSNDARTVLPMTSVRNRGAIESAIYPLQPESSTNSEAGLKLGYEIALANINPEANNRVVFLSDGVANVGETDPAKISEEVKSIREKGVYLNTIGVGMNNHNDVLLEQLADKGDGVCNYIDSPDEARKVISESFTGTFETIARDVKIQVEFDPAQVERYRLLGYENRAIADRDFRNDKIDAGEVGAGHQVTALYELELTSGSSSEKPLATVRLRWKAPRNVSSPTANEEATEIAQPVLAKSQTSFEGAGAGYRRAVVVAQFAEFLRRSYYARGESLDDLIAEADKLEKETHDPETGELDLLLHKSRSLILAALPKCDDLCDAMETLRRHELLRCERDQLLAEQDQKRMTDLGYLEDLKKQNAELEQRIRELLRRKLEPR